MPMKLSFVLLAFFLLSCSSPVHGIRMRSQSPALAEAFRKLSLAVRADDYEIARMNPDGFALETKWRDMKEKEKSEDEITRGTAVQAKLHIALSPRGTFYDVFLTPTLRYASADTSHDRFPPPTHPLIHKWKRILSTILEKESREE
jgi:hypothetical protein